MYECCQNSLNGTLMVDLPFQLERTKHITLHGNGEHLLKGSSSQSYSLPSSAIILLVVWSANGNTSALTSKARSIK